MLCVAFVLLRCTLLRSPCTVLSDCSSPVAWLWPLGDACLVSSIPGRAPVRACDSHRLCVLQHRETEHKEGTRRIPDGGQLLPLCSLQRQWSPCPERYHFSEPWGSLWKASSAGTPTRGQLCPVLLPKTSRTWQQGDSALVVRAPRLQLQGAPVGYSSI